MCSIFGEQPRYTKSIARLFQTPWHTKCSSTHIRTNRKRHRDAFRVLQRRGAGHGDDDCLHSSQNPERQGVSFSQTLCIKLHKKSAQSERTTLPQSSTQNNIGLRRRVTDERSVLRWDIMVVKWWIVIGAMAARARYMMVMMIMRRMIIMMKYMIHVGIMLIEMVWWSWWLWCRWRRPSAMSMQDHDVRSSFTPSEKSHQQLGRQHVEEIQQWSGTTSTWQAYTKQIRSYEPVLMIVW